MTMTPRRLILAAAALLAAPAVLAADPSPPPPGGETNTVVSTPRTVLPRKPERRVPNVPAKPRIIDAPGAALMLIPAAWSPNSPGGPQR